MSFNYGITEEIKMVSNVSNLGKNFVNHVKFCGNDVQTNSSVGVTLEKMPVEDEVILGTKSLSADKDSKIKYPYDRIFSIRDELAIKYNTVTPEKYPAFKMTSPNLELDVNNGIFGWFDRKVKGHIGSEKVDLKLGDKFNHMKGSLKGSIGNKEFDIKYHVENNGNLVLEGKGADSNNSEINKLLALLVRENIEFNIVRDS